MRYTKWFASIALAAGMAVAGTTAASAQDWRDARHENSGSEWLQSAVARDRARLAEDSRHGNRREIARDRAALERDGAALRAQSRDNRYDRGYGSTSVHRNGYNNDLHNYR